MRGRAPATTAEEELTATENNREILSLAPKFASRQVARFVVVLDDVDGAAFSWVPLDDRQGAIWAKVPDRLRSAVKIIVPGFAHKNSVRVLLDKIDFSVEVPVALDLDDLAVFEGFDDVRLAVAVGVDREPVFSRTRSVYPLVGSPIETTVRDGAGGVAAAGEKSESQHCT
jgi:hypothetical protein